MGKVVGRIFKKEKKEKKNTAQKDQKNIDPNSQESQATVPQTAEEKDSKE